MSEATESKKKGLLSALAPFPKPFWVINTVELFERGAYYAMLAVLSSFILADLGYGAEVRGLLLAIQFPLLYFLPPVAGAFADKLGFKRLLVLTFLFLIAGYLVLTIATTFALALLGIVLFAIGAGLFKPLPAATVTDTTSEQDRNFGFAIYYWMINLGAFVAPLAMQRVFGGSFRSYFLISAALSLLNLIIVLAMWKDIKAPDPSIKVGQSIRKLKEIFHHPSFVVLLLIYSGFWFMYAITTSFLQNYATQYGILAPEDVALLVPANALAILIVGPVLGKLTGKVPSLPLMITGITIFCAGFLLIGFVPTLLALLAGIFIFSIGEFLTHPSYLSYVSKTSPADKVPLFLGYGFISVGIGQTLGTLFGGVLYGQFAERGSQPQMFWVAIVSVGLATVAALLVYNFVLNRRRAAPAPVTTRRRGFGPTPVLATVAVLLIPALVVAGSTAEPLQAIPDDDVEALDAANLVSFALDPLTGETTEGSPTTRNLTLPANATGAATFALSWTDEAAGTGGRNAPDAFLLEVLDLEGNVLANATGQNPAGGEGLVEVTVADAPAELFVRVTCTEAGDVTTSPGGLLDLPLVGGSADDGNAWALDVVTQAAPAPAAA